MSVRAMEEEETGGVDLLGRAYLVREALARRIHHEARVDWMEEDAPETLFAAVRKHGLLYPRTCWTRDRNAVPRRTN